MSRSPGPMRCNEHEGKPYEFYCRTCKSLGCSMCVLLVHRDHTAEVSEAADVIPEHMENLRRLYEEASTNLELAQEMMDNSSATITKLKENKDIAERRIRSYFQRARNILVDRENHFINTVRKSAEEKKAVSSNIRKSVSELFQSLMFCVKGLWELSNRGDPEIMVLKEEQTLVGDLEKAVKTLKDLQKKDELLNPDTTVTLPCIEDRNFEKVCRMVGDPSFFTCPPECNGTTNNMSPLPFVNGAETASDRSFLLTPPPLPPKVPLVKERTSTDPCEDSSSTSIPIRPDTHPRSSSSIELTESVKESLDLPPPVPPRSPKLSKKANLPQWLLDYKEKANKENRRKSEVINRDTSPAAHVIPLKKTSSGNTVDDTLRDYKDGTDTKIPNQSANHKPKPKPRQSLPNWPPTQQQRSDSIYEIPVASKRNNSVQSNILLSKLDNIDNYKSRMMSPVREKPEPDPQTTPGFSSDSNDSDQIPVYEIQLKRNLKKSPFCPSGVCVGPTNTLIVWDTLNCCISMLTSTGKFLDYINNEEGGENYFNEPVHVCSDKSGHILVLDASPPRIMKFSTTGKYQSRVVPKSLRSSPLTKPRAMAIAHNGNILVTDWGRSCVHVFDGSGKFIKSFGQENANSGIILMQPTGIVVDSNGRVIITDGMAHHIWVYTPEGVVLNHFGWHGRNAGELHTPIGITVDSNGLIYVTENGNSRISVFKESGEHIKCFGQSGGLVAEFNSPRFLCMDSEGLRLIVADEGNHRLQVFEIS